MQRDLLLLGEMMEAAERCRELVAGITVEELAADRLRSESLLWNFTVLGEAATQLSAEVKGRFPDVPWQQPARLRNRIVHGYWSIDLEVLHTTASAQLPAFAHDLDQVLTALTVEDQAAGADAAEGAAANPPSGEAPSRNDSTNSAT